MRRRLDRARWRLSSAGRTTSILCVRVDWVCQQPVGGWVLSYSCCFGMCWHPVRSFAAPHFCC